MTSVDQHPMPDLQGFALAVLRRALDTGFDNVPGAEVRRLAVLCGLVVVEPGYKIVRNPRLLGE